MLRRYKRWTEADDATLCKLVRAKKTGIEHWCKVFDATRQSVNFRIKHLRDAGVLEPTNLQKFWNEKKDAELIKLRDSGKSYKQCGEILGTTESATQIRCSRIRNGRKPSGRPSISKPPPEPDKAKAEVTIVQPVHYMNVKSGQCRAFVNRTFMCGLPARKNDRCEVHAKTEAMLWRTSCDPH